MKEIIRRLGLALGLFAGLWLICSSPSALYSIKVVDWQGEKDRLQGRESDMKRTMEGLVDKDDLKGIDLAPATRGSLEAMIQEETKGRLVTQEGPLWAGLFEGIAKTLSGSPPSPAWGQRRGREYYDDLLFFRPDEAPLNDLAGKMSKEKSFTYVQIKQGSSTQYLGVTRRYGSDISHYAPLHLAYPGRFYGFMALLATALFYSLIPWQKHRVESVRYSRARSSVVPDVMGAVLAGMFFCLPILITNENAAGDGIFSGGWIILTGVMWFLALFGVSLWVISAWYASLLLELRDEGLHFVSLLRDETIPLGEIESISVGRIDNAKLNRFLIILSIFVSWKAVGPALLASGPEYGLLIRLRSGKTLTFPLKAAIGFPQMIGRLLDMGVVIDESVFEGFEARRAAPELRAPFPPLGKGVGHISATCLFVLPLAWLTFINLPPEPLKVQAGELRSAPYSSSKPKEWVPSQELMEQEERIQGEMAKLQARMKELEAVAKTGTRDERSKAAKESEECLSRFMELSEEFDKLRKADGAPD